MPPLFAKLIEFNLGVQEFIVLGCCGTVIFEAIAAAVVVLLFSRKDRRDDEVDRE